MIVEICRPEITVWDYQWISKNGPHRVDLFTPMSDEDRAVKSGGLFLRDVRHGTEPAVVLAVSDDVTWVDKGRARYLRTPDGKYHDAINAVILAKYQSHGFRFIRAGMSLPVQGPSPARPLPKREMAPVKQLSMW
jgi:hypothetical protein